jgi:hypothetical protein
MNKVFEHAGDLVNIKVAHNLMRLIAEGFGEDDDAADSQLRSSAVCDLHLIMDYTHIYVCVYHYIARTLLIYLSCISTKC